MKPTQTKKATLKLNKKAISNLTAAQMSNINGGAVTFPTPKNTLLETAIDCPCTHFCSPNPLTY